MEGRVSQIDGTSIAEVSRSSWHDLPVELAVRAGTIDAGKGLASNITMAGPTGQASRLSRRLSAGCWPVGQAAGCWLLAAG